MGRTIWGILLFLCVVPGQSFGGDESVEIRPESVSTQYRLDPKRSRLAVLVRYKRGTLVKGHDHVAQAEDFQGLVRWNPADLSECFVEISFPVSALSIDPPGSRAWLGLSGETRSSDIGKIENNMRGKHVLDAARFGSVSYKAVRCEQAGEKVRVEGRMTVHGVTVAVETQLTVKSEPNQFTAEGSFTAGHAWWEMVPYSALMGAVRNDETLSFHIQVFGTPAP
jgi:polyisoprenoid-binding protein YceI